MRRDAIWLQTVRRGGVKHLSGEQIDALHSLWWLHHSGSRPCDPARRRCQICRLGVRPAESVIGVEGATSPGAIPVAVHRSRAKQVGNTVVAEISAVTGMVPAFCKGCGGMHPLHLECHRCHSRVEASQWCQECCHCHVGVTDAPLSIESPSKSACSVLSHGNRSV